MSTLPEGSREIGNNWVETTDATTGRVYYANTATQATSWVWPEDLPKPEGAAPEWTSAVDPNTQKTYYMNRVTAETVWEKPEGYVEPAAPAASTIISSETVAASAAKAASAASDPSVTTARKVWRASLDPASGKVFYTSDQGDNTWEKPADYQEPTPARAPAPSVEDGNDLLRKPSGAGFVTESPKKPSGVGFAEEPEKTKKKGGIQFSNLSNEDETTNFSPIANEIDEDNWSSKTAKRKTHLFTSNSVLTCEGAAEAMLAGITDETSTDELLKVVTGVTFLEYAEKNFNYDRRGMFGAKTTTDRIVNFKGSEVIKTSLCKIGDKELVAEAVQSFRNITGFMGDRSSGKNADDHCLKLLTTCLQVYPPSFPPCSLFLCSFSAVLLICMN